MLGCGNGGAHCDDVWVLCTTSRHHACCGAATGVHIVQAGQEDARQPCMLSCGSWCAQAERWAGRGAAAMLLSRNHWCVHKDCRCGNLVA